MRLYNSFGVCFAAALTIAAVHAATPPIGVASAIGSLLVDGVRIQGNANLFDGSTIATTDASGRVFLEAGPALTFAVDSAAVIYKDQLVLERGGAKLEKMNHYVANALGYRIVGSRPESQAVLHISGSTLDVGALRGPLAVYSSQGILLARVTANRSSAFSPNQAGTIPAQTGAGGMPGATSGAGLQKKLWWGLGGTLGGLGLAVDAILQPTSP